MIALVLAAAAAVAAPDPSRPGPHQSYETVELAEGVVAFVAPEGRTGTVQGNTLVVIGRDAVLVVDTGQFPDLTKRMIADIDGIRARDPAARSRLEVFFTYPGFHAVRWHRLANHLPTSSPAPPLRRGGDQRFRTPAPHDPSAHRRPCTAGAPFHCPKPMLSSRMRRSSTRIG